MKVESLKYDALLRMFSTQEKRYTGFYMLDKVMNGITGGSLIVLAGATGMGKSIFALNVLANMANKGTSCMYFDLENGRERFFNRILRIRYGVSESFFSNPDNLPQAKELLDKSERENLEYIDHTMLYEMGMMNLGYKLILNIIEKRAKEGTEVFLIDPLQALETSNDPKNSLNEQGTIVREFKELAQRLNVIIIICHHMRKSVNSGGEFVVDLDEVKEVKYKIPTVDDLRGSGKISDFATSAWGLVRTISSTTKEGKGKTLLNVMKNRDGDSGYVKMFFDVDKLLFRDTTTRIDNDLFNGKVC